MTPCPATPFSLERYWSQRYAFGHIMAFLQLAMSLLRWLCILIKAHSAWRVRRTAPALDGFWAAPSLADGIALLRQTDPEQVYVALPAQGARHAGDRATLAGATDKAAQVTRVLRRYRPQQGEQAWPALN
jgi:biopolymer transport protein ExbB